MISTWQYHRRRQSEDEEILVTKQRNFSVITMRLGVEVAEKMLKEAILDDINHVFIMLIVVLRLY